MHHSALNRRAVNPSFQFCPTCNRVLRCAPDEQGHLYLAVSCFEVLEEGLEVVSFVDKLRGEWESDWGDVAVWLLTDAGAPILVASISPGLHGQPVVRWL